MVRSGRFALSADAGLQCDRNEPDAMTDHAETFPIYNIGHSTRSIDEFVALLRAGGVRQLVDVRTIPRSRTNPQYNSDMLGETLGLWQIAYTLIPELGGRRPRQDNVLPETNAWWQNQSFHNHADYALSSSFRAGLDQLIALSREAPTAIMCAEAVWWRCHRRIITDYVLAENISVCHLMGKDHVETAKRSLGAVVRLDGVVDPASPDRSTLY